MLYEVITLFQHARQPPMGSVIADVAFARKYLAGISIGLITEYYTASSPVARIAEASKT